MQLIYQETTEVSSKVLLSEGFNVTHNSNHRSNEEKAKEILLKLSFLMMRKPGKICNDKEWLLIADVFRGQ